MSSRQSPRCAGHAKDASCRMPLVAVCLAPTLTGLFVSCNDILVGEATELHWIMTGWLDTNTVAISPDLKSLHAKNSACDILRVFAGNASSVAVEAGTRHAVEGHASDTQAEVTQNKGSALQSRSAAAILGTARHSFCHDPRYRSGVPCRLARWQRQNDADKYACDMAIRRAPTL